MIYDTLKNIDNYKTMGRVYTALKMLKETDFSVLEAGRHEFDGDNIYFMVQNYTTRVGSTISEAHKKYIDIQFMVSGKEIVGVAPIENCGKPTEEKPENDYCLYECDTQPVKITDGEFVVLFPSDVHLPGCADSIPMDVKKIVVKVKVD